MNENAAENVPTQSTSFDLLAHTTQIAAAYLSKNPVAQDAIAKVLSAIRDGLMAISEPPASTGVAEKPVPAVSIRRSVTTEYIVCLEDGKKLKMLKRHLRTMYNLSPEEYRAKWGLPADYPMVAPVYAQRRSEFAKQIGLGRSRTAPPPPAPVPAAKPARGRAKKATPA